jgi:hypothetical protein
MTPVEKALKARDEFIREVDSVTIRNGYSGPVEIKYFIKDGVPVGDIAVNIGRRISGLLPGQVPEEGKGR